MQSRVLHAPAYFKFCMNERHGQCRPAAAIAQYSAVLVTSGQWYLVDAQVESADADVLCMR